MKSGKAFGPRIEAIVAVNRQYFETSLLRLSINPPKNFNGLDALVTEEQDDDVHGAKS